MPTFSTILKETNKLMQMNAEFENMFFSEQIVSKSPSIVMPATTQGEQTIPLVKPNGVTQ